MNKIEANMVEILKTLSDDNLVVSVKAEFEAEGTRPDELLRLLDITKSAGLELTVKIGGCEAIRDLMEAKQFGAKYIVAPMIESTYALSKFASAIDTVFSNEEKTDSIFLFNIETQTAFQQADELIKSALEAGIQGIVFGRVDYAGSRKMNRSEIDSEKVTNDVIQVAESSKEANLQLVVGGAVSSESIENLRRIKAIHLTRFETRKIVFRADALESRKIEVALLHAVHFELLWLLNKRDYYQRITEEDSKRIAMLEKRWKILEKNAEM